MVCPLLYRLLSFFLSALRSRPSIHIGVASIMLTPESTGGRALPSARVTNSGYSGRRLPEIVLSPPGNRHRGRDIRDDHIGVRSSGLSYIGGADRRRASVSPTNTRHPYTLPPIESFASLTDASASRPSQRPRKRSRSKISRMDGLGEWSMTRPEGGFPEFREASSFGPPGGPLHFNPGYDMPGPSGERGSYPQTWDLPASTSYPILSHPGPLLSNQPYREYHSPTTAPSSHPPASGSQSGFSLADQVYNTQAGPHTQSGYMISRDERLPGSGMEVNRTRGNSDPTSDNSGIVEASWATTTDSIINARPHTHRPDPRRFDLARQSGPLSSPIPSTGFEAIGGSRSSSRQGGAMSLRKPRSSVPTLSVTSTGGTWNRSSTPNLTNYGRMLPGNQHEAISQESIGTASGSTRDKQVEGHPPSSEDRNRPRKRTKTRVDAAGIDKENTSRVLSSSDVRDRVSNIGSPYYRLKLIYVIVSQISTYCDELCDLAEGNSV